MRRVIVGLVVVASLFLAPAAGAVEVWKTVPETPPMPLPEKAGHAHVNGIDMYYAVFGKGPPVLLIHGGLGYADVWSSQVTALASDHTVIVADSRGHGRSTRDNRPLSYDLMAEDYVALLDTLKIDKAAIVGWSDGAIIGLDIAMKHPERISRLFSHAANFTVDGEIPNFPDDATFQIYIARMHDAYLRVSPTPKEYDAFVAQLTKMWDVEPNWTEAQLGKITVPVEVVLGEHDEAIKRDHTEHLAAAIPGAKLLILPGVSHFAVMQDPALYASAVRGFLGND